MHPVTHGLVGALCFGPLGAAASLGPDLPLIAMWAASDRNRQRLPRTHWTLRAQATTHTVVAAAVAGGVAAALGGRTAGLAVGVCWLLHVLMDRLTHPPHEQWPLFCMTKGATVAMKPIGRTVLLCSGGLDSVAAWIVLGRPETVHFRFNTPYAAVEEERYLALMADYGEPARVFSLFQGLEPLGRGGAREELPLRNLLMCNFAWAMGWDTVILVQATDWSPDKRWLFAVTAGLAARVAVGQRRQLRVLRPFARWSKTRLLRAASAKDPTGTWQRRLYSCYAGTASPCGECHACRRATVAFAAAQLVPPYAAWAASWPRDSWWSFLRWAQADAPRYWALGSLIYTPIRLRELWQAWSNVGGR